MKRLIIIMMLLTACGNTGNNGRAAEDGERVIYGDSITAICDSYVDGLNRAVHGHTTIDVLNKARHFKYTDGDADYTILIGVNDVFSGIDEQYIYRMGRILDNLNGRVEIITILPTRFAHINKKIVHLNSALYTLNVPIIDRYDEFIDNEGMLKVAYTTDGVHLSDNGCKKLYGGQYGI